MSRPEGPLVIYRRARGVTGRRKLESFARVLMEEVAAGRPFLCLVTDDRELRRLNRDFLGQDEATDVLSFPSGATPGPLGEIAISADRAREQAVCFGHSIEEEVSILMLHGLLHLIGMDHHADRGRMRRAESRWRQRLGLPAGLIERTQR